MVVQYYTISESSYLYLFIPHSEAIVRREAFGLVREDCFEHDSPEVNKEGEDSYRTWYEYCTSDQYPGTGTPSLARSSLLEDLQKPCLASEVARICVKGIWNSVSEQIKGGNHRKEFKRVEESHVHVRTGTVEYSTGTT